MGTAYLWHYQPLTSDEYWTFYKDTLIQKLHTRMIVNLIIGPLSIKGKLSGNTYFNILQECEHLMLSKIVDNDQNFLDKKSVSAKWCKPAFRHMFAREFIK